MQSISNFSGDSKILHFAKLDVFFKELAVCKYTTEGLFFIANSSLYGIAVELCSSSCLLYSEILVVGILNFSELYRELKSQC